MNRPWPARSAGIALAVAAANPAALGGSQSAAVLSLLLSLATGALAWWAAPPFTGRPVEGSTRLSAQLARYRSTVLPVVCVGLAALTGPPPWLVVCCAALLVCYLLITDRPVTERQPSYTVPASVLATAAVLLAAFAPATATGWARLPVALALGATALAVGGACWARFGTGST